MNGVILSVLSLGTILICFTDSKTVRSYEAKLENNASDVVKFADDAWNIFVNKDGSKVTVTLKATEVMKARSIVVGEKKRYTILVKYTIKDSNSTYFCIIFVKIQNSEEPIFVQCYKAPIESDNPNKYDEGMMKMFNYFNSIM